MAGTPGDTKISSAVKTRQNGAAIRALREMGGWSQEGLAGEAGIDRSYLSLIESESRNAPVRIISRIARELRVPVAAIMRELDEPNGTAA
jgi:transcriptional regulator with XRE-family HTH domain